MDNVVTPRVDMAVRLITELSGRGPSSIVQPLDQRHFSGNTEITPHKSASSQLGLDIDQNRYDETRNAKNSNCGNFPAMRFDYDRQAHAHHMLMDILLRKTLSLSFTQDEFDPKPPLPQQFTQPQNLAAHITPDNTIAMVEKTPQRQNSDSSNSINTLAEAIEGIASHQQPQTWLEIFKSQNKKQMSLRRQKR